MAKLSYIRDKYEDELFNNEITGVIQGKAPDLKSDTPIEIELVEATDFYALFRYKAEGNICPLKITDLSMDMKTDFSTYPEISHIFWLYGIENNRCVIRYIPCGKGNCFETTLDIGFGHKYEYSFLNSNRAAKVERIPYYLKEDFSFNSDFGEYLIIETFPYTDNQITIHGATSAVDIDIKEHKYILRKYKKKSLGKLSNFLGYNFVRYSCINFVDESHAKEILEQLKLRTVNGEALLALWEKYSELEYRFAEDLSNEFGDIYYTETRYLSEYNKSLKLKLSDDQVLSFSDHRDDIKNVSVRLADKDKGDIYKIRKFYKRYNNWYLDIVDVDDTLPSSGVLSISIQGNKSVKDRREKAKNTLERCATPILHNLRFIIEGLAEHMLDLRWHKEKSLTDRTRKYLMDRGITELTQNQKDAIELAINTPDICIIQGPPGTGKSTVIAAICDRLTEIAEKEEKKARKKRKDRSRSKKQILLSAFQNDTVEHIASKVETLGLPTLKVGKESVSTPAEDVLKNKMKKHIDDVLHKLAGAGDHRRFSKIVAEAKDKYVKERIFHELRVTIEKILTEVVVSDILLAEWREICADLSPKSPKKNRQIEALRNLSTEIDTYNDSGYRECYKVQHSGLPFTEEELTLLESAPDENPSEEFLNGLSILKEKYIKLLDDESESLSNSLNSEILSWLDEFIIFNRQLEEDSYQDIEVFLSAVLENIREDLDGNDQYIRDTLQNYSESLAATNQKAGSRSVQDIEFENVILEEAARSNPLDLLIPMTHAISRIILVGDHQQLPQLIEPRIVDEAVIDVVESTDRESRKKSYALPLFRVIYENLEKAYENGSIAKRFIRLNEQFRMHPIIGDFISSTYYEGNLHAGIKDQDEKRRHGLTVCGLKDKVMVFCDVNERKGYETPGKGKIRIVEAKRVIRLVQDILADSESINLSIGVITFYALQRDKIFEEAEKVNLAVRLDNGDYEIMPSLRLTPDGREKLRIGTVDSFQGKEFDVVILSTVRSNNIACEDSLALKKYGFLTLENRLNVAFSRAQRLLIVCGDGKMFDNDFAKKHVEGLYEFYTNQSNNPHYGARIE